MRDIFQDFKFVPDGATNLVDALCRFIKEEITFGRITGGEKLPTIGEMCKATGLTFAQARRVTECLSREGYVCSRPHVGTVVLSRKGNVLRGRVLFILPDIDMGRYHPSQVIDTLSRRLTASGYAFSVATFSLDAADSLAVLESELLRATDLVVAARATPQVQKVLAESGVDHFFLYGDKLESDDRPWIRFSPEEALSQFADHCLRAGVKHVAQVRNEGADTLDAQPALAERGIDSSWMTISCSKEGWGRFDGIVHCGYEAFATMPRTSIPELLLFWDGLFTQGATMAFLARGIKIPEDVKIVTFSNAGIGPVYIKPVTRIEINPVEAGEKVADFALAILTRGRIPRPPQIKPHYVIGETFPF
ncbi:MAG: substrate-binding domain-containing protein [Kiritimatiellae bacterium]|nr:substrate-binding domain-containing protein [Kiritimatiellia bacterium]